MVGAIEKTDVLEEAAQDIAVELQQMKDEQERKNGEQDGRIRMLEDMNVEEHAKQAEKIGHLETVTKVLLNLIKELKGGGEEAMSVAKPDVVPLKGRTLDMEQLQPCFFTMRGWFHLQSVFLTSR